MKIDAMSAQPDRLGRHLVTFEDGSVMRLYRQTIEDFCLYTGKELEDHEAAKLKEAAGLMSAKMRAVRIVSAASVSRKDLEQRLLSRGEDPDQARSAVEWMAELNLVDDAKMAEQVVQRCAAKGYGIARAKQMLYEKRIPKRYWDGALQDYPDQAEYIQSFLHAHVSDPDDARMIKKAIDALLRRGHSYGDIRRGLEQLSVDLEDFRGE